MSEIIIALNAGILAVIVLIGICRLNLMTRGTRLTVRLAYLWITVAAFDAMVGSHNGGFAYLLLHGGMLAVLLADARRSHCFESNRECWLP